VGPGACDYLIRLRRGSTGACWIGGTAKVHKHHCDLQGRCSGCGARFVPAFPGSSYGRFSVPSKAANKGNGKNLAAHRISCTAFCKRPCFDLTARLPDCRSPRVSDSRPKTTKRTAAVMKGHASFGPKARGRVMNDMRRAERFAIRRNFHRGAENSELNPLFYYTLR
jgi:hypothetical protein